uniref:Putative ovule protein n=1 Tax=Solanum chacoense TaxID=4108 RepID=A0A0V0HJN8_SOLCH
MFNGALNVLKLCHLREEVNLLRRTKIEVGKLKLGKELMALLKLIMQLFEIIKTSMQLLIMPLVGWRFW